jgi:hypothetical protein
MMRTFEATATVTGSDGSAAGSAQMGVVDGFIHGVYVDYTTQPATCDVTITDDLGQAILTLTNANTDGWFYPREQVDDTAGSAISATYDKIGVSGYVSVAVAGGNAGAVAVTLLVED